MSIDFNEDDVNRNLRMEQISDAMDDSDFEIVIDDQEYPYWAILMPKVGEEIEGWDFQ